MKIFLCTSILYGQNASTKSNNAPNLLILGTLQDGGSPHIGCEKECCKDFDPNKKIVPIGINVEEIPHPLVTESIKLFENLSLQDKNKVYFIHLNHTNPLLNKKSDVFQTLTKKGFHVATINMRFNL